MLVRPRETWPCGRAGFRRGAGAGDGEVDPGRFAGNTQSFSAWAAGPGRSAAERVRVQRAVQPRARKSFGQRERLQCARRRCDWPACRCEGTSVRHPTKNPRRRAGTPRRARGTGRARHARSPIPARASPSVPLRGELDERRRQEFPAGEGIRQPEHPGQARRDRAWSGAARRRDSRAVS